MNIVAIYPGRFQPFSRHHFESFKWLQNKFGKENTYIATSDVVNLPKSPLSFEEKMKVFSKFGISDKVVQCKSPYAPKEILSKYDPKTTAVVMMVGQKDMEEDPRFSMKPKKSGEPGYFQKYEEGKKLEGYENRGYLIVAPHVSIKIPGIGEMSGTNVRKALSSKDSDVASATEVFKHIFGWYDPKVFSMLRNKFSQTNEHKLNGLTMRWSKPLHEAIEDKAIFISVFKELIQEDLNLLKEGGAASHMAHPFDIPSVKTGNDLLNIFKSTADYLKTNPSTVKVDGINVSIRMNPQGEFVLDRGSMKPLDIAGVKVSDLEARFSPGHGMVKYGKIVLDLFNSSKSIIKPELDALGFTKDPSLMFNIEYVEGHMNVQKYDDNFIFIHNVFRLPIDGSKRSPEQVKYDKNLLNSIIKKINPIAQKQGFKMVHEVQTKIKKPISFSSALSKNYTINYSQGKKETKPLSALLSSAKNTKGVKLKLRDGKTVDALSKQVYFWIRDGKNVLDLVDQKDIKTAVDSFTIYLATEVLGDEILKSLTSDMGDLDTHEGIVVRNPRIYSGPYKITGSFITRGVNSKFNVPSE